MRDGLPPIAPTAGSPDCTKGRTFRAVFELPDHTREPNLKKENPLRAYRNPIILAREWQRALESEDCPSKAALARKLGVTRARVTQVLRLLRLDQKVTDAIAALGDPLPSPVITERRLRPIVDFPPEEQRQHLATLLINSFPAS
jgi:hypothetical protein